MNENTELDVRPEVADFVAAVRARLRDLPTEDQQELTEGLEADLSDQVAEQGTTILGDANDYASELRVAAGFPAEPKPMRSRRPLGEWVDADLDGLHRRWDGLVSGLPGDPWGFMQSLRPAWWIVRAWVALQLVDLVWGGGSYNYGLSLLPSLGGFSWPLLVVAVVGSVLIGRGDLWPGRTRSGPGGRVLLGALNVFAAALLPVVCANLFTASKAESWYGDDPFATQQVASETQKQAGILADGKWISQVYPYDAAGKPLVGVQLFDQEGQPINLVTQTECVYDAQGNTLDKGRVHYPWTNGASQVRNVVPVPSVIGQPGVPDPDPQAFQREVKPTIGQFPMGSVPAVSLPGIKTSVGQTPKGAVPEGALPKSPINGIDAGC